MTRRTPRNIALAALFALPLVAACEEPGGAAAADDEGGPDADSVDPDEGDDEGGDGDADEPAPPPACERASRSLALDEVSEAGIAAAEIVALAAGARGGVLRYEGGGEVGLHLEVAYEGGAIAIDHAVGDGCPADATVTVEVLVGLVTADAALKEAGAPARLVYRADDPAGVLVDLQPIDLALLHGELAPPEAIDGIGAAEFGVITFDAALFIGPPRALLGPGGAVVDGVNGLVFGTGELDAWSCPAGQEASCPGPTRSFLVGAVLLDP